MMAELKCEKKKKRLSESRLFKAAAGELTTKNSPLFPLLRLLRQDKERGLERP